MCRLEILITTWVTHRYLQSISNLNWRAAYLTCSYIITLNYDIYFLAQLFTGLETTLSFVPNSLLMVDVSDMLLARVEV